MLVTINHEIDEIRMIIQGLQCAACISEDNGHEKQAKTFRELWTKLQEEIE